MRRARHSGQVPRSCKVRLLTTYHPNLSYKGNFTASKPPPSRRSFCLCHLQAENGVEVEAAPQVPASAPSRDNQSNQGNWEREIEETLKLVSLLPLSVRSALEDHPDMFELLEVVMDLGRPPLARFPSGDLKISEHPVTQEDLDYAVSQVGAFGGDNRAGIDCTLHRISCLRNRKGKIIGLTCRVGRAIPGSADMVHDLVMSGGSILFLGRPGVGKTTAIREVSRMLAEELGKRVVIVDTSNEIGGDGDIPHPGIGKARRMQVPDPEQQHKVMIEAVENHMPQVIVIDEIGTEPECLAARTIAQRGVMLVATAHGNELENVIKNPSLSDLVGGIQSVTLGDEEAKRRKSQKSILERAAPPTFDVAIEMLERHKWRLHTDVARAVDIVLMGGQAQGQIRERAADGSVLTYTYNDASGSQSREPVVLRSPPGTPQGSLDESSGPSPDRAASSSPTPELLPHPTLPGGQRPSEFVRSPLQELGPALKRSSRAVNPEDALLRVYPYEIEEEKLWEVLEEMDMDDKVYFSPVVDQADAILALRSKIKQNTHLRGQAKQHAIPIYAVKSPSKVSLGKAFRTLLGIDPSAGALFMKKGAAREESWDLSPSNSLASEDDEGGDPMSSQVAAGKLPFGSWNEEEGMREAQVAMSELVIPLQQPVELKPRTQAIVDLQLALIRDQGLEAEVLDPGSTTPRCRILPPGYVSRGPEPDINRGPEGEDGAPQDGASGLDGDLVVVGVSSGSGKISQ